MAEKAGGAMSTDPLKALLTEIQKVEKRRVKKALTWEALGEEIQNALNGGKPLEEDVYSVMTSADAGDAAGISQINPL